ncbi:MAG: chemotaxis protein CheX [Lachnospiraceae bacterium]|nr:chemotaxis protein CheX [Lachnospiraceae bacterium]
MVESIIGSYLMDSGRITAQQFRSALDKMDAVRVKLGLIAVSEGFMTFAQAEEVNRLQAICDKRFGDIAVEKGYLSNEQVGKLLKRQGDAYLAFIQALEDDHLITIGELSDILDEFKMKYCLTNTELEDIKSDDVEKIVDVYLPEQAKEYAGLIGIAIKTLIRLVDRHASIDKMEMKKVLADAPMAKQEMKGEEAEWTNGMKEIDGALLTIASFFGQEDFEELDEDALDAVAELMNCINGLYASSLSNNHGKLLELMPPEYDEEGVAFPDKEACVVTVRIDGRLCEFAALKSNL